MTPQLTLSGRTARILLDAPERRNALGPDDLHALVRALDEIERSDTADVAIVGASGETFCAGYDLGALRSELDASQTSDAQREFARVVDTLEDLRVPTICAMRGGAYGGGTDLALACDIRVGTPRTTLSVPAVRFGLQFYSGGLRRFVERLGVDAAKRIFLLAETLDSNELLRLGFLHEVVADGELDARVESLAERLLSNVQPAVRGLKRSLNALARGIARNEAIDDAFVASFRAPETLERLEGRFRSRE
ncbi:MAG: enoyl-CoA hydratase/isomerase family protein [Candidatus Eremiobacteraeota bacterium]|nr:enoyl-CoA hydratase/isomerase family protein [Candidatus Eremiobacteraeota bacterium]